MSQKQIATHRNPKIYPLTKLEILNSNNIGDIILDLRPGANVKVTVTEEQYMTVCDSKMYRHTTFWIPMSNAPGMIILELGPEVKVKITVAEKWYATLRDPHAVFGIPTLNNEGDMPRTQYSRTETRGQGQGHSDTNGMPHFATP